MRMYHVTPRELQLSHADEKYTDGTLEPGMHSGRERSRGIYPRLGFVVASWQDGRLTRYRAEPHEQEKRRHTGSVGCCVSS